MCWPDYGAALTIGCAGRRDGTKPTGRIATYKHAHWVKEDPKNFKTGIAEYEVHEPEQEAYGDWAAICIGGQYYLFGDHDPAGGHQMSAGWFTSPSIDQQSTWCDKIGKGHPDPDIAFAEGRFYLATQLRTDFVSPGPWVETVEARVGVDTGDNCKIDKWTNWTEVKESYDYTPAFPNRSNEPRQSRTSRNFPGATASRSNSRSPTPRKTNPNP